ncbi:MAG TPA: adenylosuccinate synthase [Polyangiaceae bacterium]|jgi:adenylosuccinate synthase|nr:MAG: Adenylosuccinate synthetase [Deltaproteobacteria bacterium ADurb.Bin207]HNS99843.1 adenylosuccinate synthase [Polyangiaceae bacterium]HNZ22125.1 adenylosuccinate synthase [Polyangiaceae bacterium]HOD21379.1 adenylosuccinate synthase [Polyangiaceae bacterium]HOE46949.1 adenylosuccinate synthase [Polyangiaceae bacterium]
MSAVVVVGAQWGDEGKGKIIDYLAEFADVVARFAGGPNAGHTLVVDGQKTVVRLIPSGILRPDKTCLMGPGMVIDPKRLVDEIDELSRRGVSVSGRLFISYRAHLILPYHLAADVLRERGDSKDQIIGTTKRGIGPAYEDKVARRGLPMAILRDLDRAQERIEAALETWAPYFQSRKEPLPDVRDLVADLVPLAERIVPFLADTSALLEDSLRQGKTILFEGAQGTLLDIDHGTYPYVTSSSATAGGVCTGSGIGPRVISRVIGAAKAYVTRVGSGPFPTELFDDTATHLQQVGGEFGSVTGRPRRTGWLDLPALRYAVRVNSLDSLVITKLDVLTGLNPLRVCVAYDTPEGRTSVLPVDRFDHLQGVTPVYETLPGWDEPLDQIRAFEDLPDAARQYLHFIESACGVPCDLVSIGPGRDAIIVRNSPFSSR